MRVTRAKRDSPVPWPEPCSSPDASTAADRFGVGFGFRFRRGRGLLFGSVQVPQPDELEHYAADRTSASGECDRRLRRNADDRVGDNAIVESPAQSRP